MIHKTKNHHHKWLLALLVIGVLVYVIGSPDARTRIIEQDYYQLIQLALFLPGFFILMSLFEVWLPEKWVVNHLGKQSGVSGSFYSFLLGAMIPGPLYIAFPIAGSLLKKGVSRFNITLFIGAWSAFKLGEEIFEFQFLGPKFLFLRLAVSLPFIILIGLIIEHVHFSEK